jgi:CheY-like chemotaxis protein
VRTDRLASQLRVEKAAADEARRAAEAASLAKTQFFAAASHDLRQPLHAMGLFAEALRQRSHDAEAAALINSINESVDALEGLFAELLDITRIDSGGVDVNPQPVPVRELFARLKLQFEPVAFEKGLALRFHGERHVLHTDPVIVERILRNLISNAIRYTEDGGVLVGCRRRGERVLLQVWDSGIGIDESALPRVFDEFYQVQSQRPLDAHDRKGLGLGLAIVKRLAGLIDAPLALHSVAGRGTVFDLLVPPGRVPKPAATAATASRALPGLTLEGRTIAIVEDELAVREGLEVLLQSWGARVLAFESFDRVERWAGGGARPRPDLLICDYRLPDQRNGVEAIVAVRQALGEPVPAIVVTGSMMSGHEAEAEAHDFHLLIKPVVPNKLRAMIAFKLGMR